MSTLTSRTARSRLRRGPWHWSRIRVGLSLGWRRAEGPATGQWAARAAIGSGKSTLHVLGAADDVAGAGMDHDEAAEATLTWAAERVGDDRARNEITLHQAVERYATACRERGSERYAHELQNLTQNHLGHLAQHRVAALTIGFLRRWRRGLPATLKPSTRENLVSQLGAALRHADILPREMLRRALAPSTERMPDEPRAVNMTDAAVARLVAECYAHSTDAGLLAELVSVTGVRPAQLIRCRVSDLDVTEATLRVPPSMKGKKATVKQPAIWPLPRTLVERLAPGPHGVADLLLGRSYADGVRTSWIRSAWADIVRDAAVRAELDGVSLYHLRHHAVQRALLNGVPVAVLARALDTSARQIERAYASVLAQRAESVDVLRRLVTG